ncbi:sugar/nucleoside kinase (ribokinase family) [Orbus hercynius]|uniref:Sugar/nucleoside kinase (Ribokinase family) n=1 Tax=Orbus hercynius TaxID=593135 RepID=A0A495RH43_9GAMM|nr:sugar kinase [Orbus hercynius]RKS86078.1 sugar/nucleoside kinase (ribokinase family) [Orbus hercynius]
MNFKICTMGELLVEFLAKEQHQRFDEIGEFIGPFPSGAPAIFASQIAKLGFPVVFFSCVGKDVFGKMCVQRLKADGVIIDGISTHHKATTGSAFVSYKGHNERDFIFNIPNSACGLLSFDHINENLLKDCNHLHVMGSSLYSFRVIDAMRKALDRVKNNGGTISFDPNLRKEMFDIPEMEASFDYIMDYTDIFLPSESEVSYFASQSGESEYQTMMTLLERGVKHIVVKGGAKGANYYGRDQHNNVQTLQVESYGVNAVDPTGAGDCFGATFVSLMLAGYDVESALQYANASGALAVLQKGPMEGTSTLAQLQQFIASQAS